MSFAGVDGGFGVGAVRRGGVEHPHLVKMREIRFDGPVDPGVPRGMFPHLLTCTRNVLFAAIQNVLYVLMTVGSTDFTATTRRISGKIAIVGGTIRSIVASPNGQYLLLVQEGSVTLNVFDEILDTILNGMPLRSVVFAGLVGTIKDIFWNTNQCATALVGTSLFRLRVQPPSGTADYTVRSDNVMVGTVFQSICRGVGGTVIGGVQDGLLVFLDANFNILSSVQLSLPDDVRQAGYTFFKIEMMDQEKMLVYGECINGEMGSDMSTLLFTDVQGRNLGLKRSQRTQNFAYVRDFSFGRIGVLVKPRNYWPEVISLSSAMPELLPPGMNLSLPANVHAVSVCAYRQVSATNELIGLIFLLASDGYVHLYKLVNPSAVAQLSPEAAFGLTDQFAHEQLQNRDLRSAVDLNTQYRLRRQAMDEEEAVWRDSVEARFQEQRDREARYTQRTAEAQARYDELL